MSSRTIKTDIQKLASQHTLQERKLAKQNPNNTNPTIRKATKPIRVWPRPAGQQPRSPQLPKGPAAGAKPWDSSHHRRRCRARCDWQASLLPQAPPNQNPKCIIFKPQFQHPLFSFKICKIYENGPRQDPLWRPKSAKIKQTSCLDSNIKTNFEQLATGCKNGNQDLEKQATKNDRFLAHKIAPTSLDSVPRAFQNRYQK